VARGSAECIGGAGALTECGAVSFKNVLGRFSLRYFAPHIILTEIAGVSSTSLPLRYNAMTSLCSLVVERSSPGVGTRVGTSLRTKIRPRVRPSFLRPQTEGAASSYP